MKIARKGVLRVIACLGYAHEFGSFSCRSSDIERLDFRNFNSSGVCGASGTRRVGQVFLVVRIAAVAHAWIA